MDSSTCYNLLDLFHNKKLVKVCAPMVRYSKYQFRTLVREYDCDLCFTPMILADSFCRSQKARDNEFITNTVDQPLVVQFAANTVHDFVGAAYMASPFCNGVDLNCGCPQRWARSQGIGCVMLEHPELIYDIVRQCRNHISKPFTVSVKMRILSDIKKSVEICRQLERCGVSFLTVHGRTASQKTDNVHTDALRTITQSVHCPVIANGGVKNLSDAYQLQEITKCKGVMVANAILSNPTLFTGSNETSVECVQKWLDICFNSEYESKFHFDEPTEWFDFSDDKMKPLTFQCFHHHLVFMLEKMLAKKSRRIFNNLKDFKSVLDFLNENLNIKPQKLDKFMYELYKPIRINYEKSDEKYFELLANFADEDESESSLSNYDYNATSGKFFNNIVSSVDDDTYISELF